MAANRRPTLADVAREVGVSAKTVSRVLNEDGPASARTREQVLAAVAKLGFQPNLMARNIRVGGPDTTIGLVVPDLGNPFFGAVAGGIEDIVRDRGLTLLMGSSADEPARERELTDKFLARRISILMVIPSVGSDHSHLRSHRSTGLPVVFVDRPGAGLTTDSVVSSNLAGAHEGVAHLIAHGHRRIGFVGDLPTNLYTRRERLAGYRSALAEAGLPHDRSLVINAHDQQGASACTSSLLELASPPTALFAGNNIVALGVVAELARIKRKDVAVVAFDDVPLAEALEPALTVVAQDPEEIGRKAAETALARLDGDRSRARTITVPTRLIVRGSGELTAS
ncbi:MULTISPECIES: LacI family DNA-binding transcriptional regulator [Streptomyces]|uniref:LacI family transcriptional regulator n=2 Tax=Streptomyces TaxID=1883 RepID=A0ABZ1FYI0_9ACTN|nr:MULTISPECIES: LacI family DNA-binding transcriptional regulator [Streptomyces]MBW5250474.1 LacI family DNA-binding transcriptional regulator [Streptomyces poriferorum]MBW5259552.1 LacI family DNA-binding transcriptional regulator [Streptomyces poriferorum]MDP5315535.1 LacI family DNA-binding transcriptional regulator [Streptomyces sp. Alt4]WLQ51642.1 LacI family DNA-binding transcriptional regulator [Streptomyces sp. Alt1]WLQ55616.1 LacI family DNA-binding transcriptional regulator [Strepto